jgi:hypothetical protein
MYREREIWSKSTRKINKGRKWKERIILKWKRNHRDRETMTIGEDIIKK